jgi:hypothetical protein
MIFPKCFQNCNPFLSLEILTLSLKENWPVIDNRITDSKSSTNKPLCPTSLGSRGKRNNWNVYGLQNMLCCHHLQSDTRRFTYHPLTYTSHCFIVYICWMNSCRRWSNWSGHRCNQLRWSQASLVQTRVSITGTGWGACTRTLGHLVRIGRSEALNSGASPNLRRERLSSSRTGFTLKKKRIVKQTVKLFRLNGYCI